jgi:hypothetical protein
MRTWGRTGQVNGIGGTWVEVLPDANGDVSMIWLTTLCQALKLSTNESPFFANTGIPAQNSVMTQTFPDFAATQTQMQFAPHFASLVITRVQGSSPPVYNVGAVCFNGAILTTTVAT